MRTYALQDIVQYDTRATLDIGAVTASNSQYSVTITFDVVLVKKDEEGDVWISTGMAYTVAGTEYIWISQCDITGYPADTTVCAPGTRCNC